MSRGNYFLNDPDVVFEHGHPIVSETNSGFLSKEIYRDFRTASLSNKYWNFFTNTACFGVDYITGETYVAGKIPCFLSDVVYIHYDTDTFTYNDQGFITVTDGNGLTVHKYTASTSNTYTDQWVSDLPTYVGQTEDGLIKQPQGFLIEPQSKNIDHSAFADTTKWVGTNITLSQKNNAGLINRESVDANILDQSILLTEVSGDAVTHKATRVIPKTFSGEPLSVSLYVKIPPANLFKALEIKILNLSISGAFSDNSCYIYRNPEFEFVAAVSTPTIAKLKHVNAHWVRVEISNEYVSGVNPVIELTTIWMESSMTGNGEYKQGVYDSALVPGDIEIAGVQIESLPAATSYVYPAPWLDIASIERFETRGTVPISNSYPSTVYGNPTHAYLNPYQGTILLTETSETDFSVKLSMWGINGESVHLYCDYSRICLEVFVNGVSKNTTGHISRFPASYVTRTHILQWDLRKTNYEITHKIIEMTNGTAAANIKGVLTTRLSLQHPDLTTLLENGFNHISFGHEVVGTVPKQLGMKVQQFYGFTSVLPDELTESILRLTIQK